MNYCITTCALLLALVVSAAGQQYNINPLGGVLTGRNVFGLGSSSDGWIFAAVDEDGIYYHNPLDLTPDGWHFIGMQGWKCRDVAVHPQNRSYLLVALARSSGKPDLIYRTTDGGQRWERSQIGIIMEGADIGSTIRLRFHPSNPALVAFISPQGCYFSADTGKSWSMVAGLQTMLINDIIWDTTRPGVMFAVGESTFREEMLLRSLDWGQNWNNTLQNLEGIEPLESIAINPANPSLMAATSRRHLLRSTNAGQSWSVAGELEDYHFHSLAWNTQTPSTLFLAGGIDDTNGGEIVVSHDAGASQQIIARDPAAPIQRGITVSSYPGAFIFSAGRPFPGETRADGNKSAPNNPGGVYSVTRQPASVAVEAVTSRAWFDGSSIHITTGNVPARRITWELRDIMGRPVASGTTPENQHAAISTAAYPNGIYLLRHDAEGREKAMKIMVAR